MSVLLIRRQRPIGDPVSPASSEDRSTYDGVAGAGRIVQSLFDLGVNLEGPSQLVLDANASPDQLAAIDLDRRSDVVILASHLVNVPDADARRGFLAVVRRHLAPGGALLLEHHPLDWAHTAEPTRPTPGGPKLGMVDVRRHPPFVSAVSVYDVGGRLVRQPFTARVLSEVELAAELEAVGLVIGRRLSPTWLEASTTGRQPRVTATRAMDGGGPPSQAPKFHANRCIHCWRVRGRPA